MSWTDTARYALVLNRTDWQSALQTAHHRFDWARYFTLYQSHLLCGPPCRLTKVMHPGSSKENTGAFHVFAEEINLHRLHQGIRKPKKLRGCPMTRPSDPGFNFGKRCHKHFSLRRSLVRHAPWRANYTTVAKLQCLVFPFNIQEQFGKGVFGKAGLCVLWAARRINSRG